MNSERGGCRTCTGKEMDVLHAQETLVSSALTVKTVPSELIPALTEGDVKTVALGYNWHFLGPTGMSQFSTHGMKLRISVSTLSSNYIPMSEVLSPDYFNYMQDEFRFLGAVISDVRCFCIFRVCIGCVNSVSSAVGIGCHSFCNIIQKSNLITYSNENHGCV